MSVRILDPSNESVVVVTVTNVPESVALTLSSQCSQWLALRLATDYRTQTAVSTA